MANMTHAGIASPFNRLLRSRAAFSKFVCLFPDNVDAHVDRERSVLMRRLRAPAKHADTGNSFVMRRTETTPNISLINRKQHLDTLGPLSPLQLTVHNRKRNPMRYKRSPILQLLAVTFPLLGMSVQANADSDAASASASNPVDDDWHFNLGVGAMSTPKYPGASEQKFRAVPMVGVSHDRFFFGSNDAVPTAPFGLGAYLYRDQHWQAGIALSYDLFGPRKESDDETRLHGLGDIDRTAHATLFGRYTHDWFSAYSSVTTDIGGKHEGTQIRLGADMRHELTPKLTLITGPCITWSSSQSNQTFYGVDAEQSARSGYSQYSPKAGISDVSFSVGANYSLTRNWNIGARATASYLPTKISDSPVVGSKGQVNFGVFANYRF